ncbi:MAG: DNA polymerase III subunit [Steroidobacteraceae bacterium]
MDAGDSLSWLATPRSQLRAARDADRLPHAVLLLGPPGIGKLELARWLASLVLCTAPAGPCGGCAGCELFAAGNHPDLTVCGLLEDAASIKVEQIRALIEAMTLKSYLGGYKVAILSPADRMNTSSFNALLKLLEEPPDQTLLILTTVRLDAIPVTVASRCQRLPIAVPAPPQALAWLEARKPGTDWALPLALAAGVPARALVLEEQGVRQLFDEVAATVAGRSLDVVAAAAHWVEDRPAERLRCLEQCLVALVRSAFGSDPVNNSHRFGLPTSGRLPDIRTLIHLIDATREALARLEGQLNLQLMLEALLVRVKSAFT